MGTIGWHDRFETHNAFACWCSSFVLRLFFRRSVFAEIFIFFIELFFVLARPTQFRVVGGAWFSGELFASSIAPLSHSPIQPASVVEHTHTRRDECFYGQVLAVQELNGVRCPRHLTANNDRTVSLTTVLRDDDDKVHSPAGCQSALSLVCRPAARGGPVATG